MPLLWFVFRMFNLRDLSRRTLGARSSAALLGMMSQMFQSAGKPQAASASNAWAGGGDAPRALVLVQAADASLKSMLGWTAMACGGRCVAATLLC